MGQSPVKAFLSVVTSLFLILTSTVLTTTETSGLNLYRSRRGLTWEPLVPLRCHAPFDDHKSSKNNIHVRSEVYNDQPRMGLIIRELNTKRLITAYERGGLYEVELSLPLGLPFSKLLINPVAGTFLKLEPEFYASFRLIFPCSHYRAAISS
eukprot:UC4_evm1s1110